jgi:hypothetical protein
VVELLRMARRAGFVTGTDDHMAAGHYVHTFRRNVDYISFHTFRNPDPTAREIQKILQKNAHPVLFSETTCYTEVPGYKPGLTTMDKGQIIRLMNIMKDRPGARWFFHSKKTLMTDTLDFWIPVY